MQSGCCVDVVGKNGRRQEGSAQELKALFRSRSPNLPARFFPRKANGIERVYRTNVNRGRKDLLDYSSLRRYVFSGFF
jgi:hypothetical protein